MILSGMLAMASDKSFQTIPILAEDNWQSWRWHMSHSIKTPDELGKWINITDRERRAIEASSSKYKWRVTPYYASLMSKDDENCPIRLQAIPHSSELLEFNEASIDPVGDTIYRKTNRVIHKYPDRVVLLVTQTCPVYCRHCTRKYHTTDKEGTYFEQGEGASFEEDFKYIEDNPQIKDVLLTGGDPLTYADHKLEEIISRIRAIPHVEIIRIGSRFPVLLPQRITDDLCGMLSKYHPVWFSTHFNHPKELTKEAVSACDRLLRHGIPVQNQTVLLKGINDTPEIMTELMRGLLRARVKPYYLYHCDNVSGVSHFMTSIERGREIMSSMLGHISGYALPRYIITTTLGKIPLERAYLSDEEGSCTLENYKGETIQLGHSISAIPEPKL